MQDWNVIATTRDHRYRDARSLLDTLCRTGRTHFYNVLVGHVDEPLAFLESLHAAPDAPELLTRVVPATTTFFFHDDEEWRRRSLQVAVAMSHELAGERFHVRVHWRGFETHLRRTDEERRLDDAIVEATAERGVPAEVAFDDPDAILVFECVGERCGASMWSREQLSRWPLLHLD